MDVNVGGMGVLVGATLVALGADVGVNGMGVLVEGLFVALGADVRVDGMGVLVRGMLVALGADIGVFVGTLVGVEGTPLVPFRMICGPTHKARSPVGSPFA